MERGKVMGKVELYYSSEMAEPWCDIEEIRGLLGKLKEKGISVDFVDTAKIPASELKEFYTTSVIAPSIKKKYKISGLFGTRRAAGCFFGRERPGLVVYRKGTTTPVDVYPHDSNGRRITVADYLKERLRSFQADPSR
jgi:hypothetical protein